ncbi:T9SS C-terminal target domain-containing protein [candidate division KSB1 bacterium]|nr:T9SS type A sorting domain-containing protein [candidate division KSB1 bacterium]RQW01327.1 MAG: T9SS C-terminal target domain-containing protein [candidate division KSB1 bacterium]
MRHTLKSYILLFVCLAVVTVWADSWKAEITATLGEEQVTRTFGGHPDASDAYDTNLDVLTPPPGQNFYAYFRIATFPTYLNTDIRGWVDPYKETIEWNLVLLNTVGETVVLTWDVSQLPEKGLFKLHAGETVNMRQQQSVEITGDQTVKITYERYSEFTYRFSGEGWYLISLPLDPPDASVTTLFPDALGGVAYEWDNVAFAYKTVKTLKVGVGYWIAMPSVKSQIITGDPVYIYARTLQQGWHMIGSVLNNADFSAPNDDPDGSVHTPAFGWTVPDGPYYETKTLTQGNGFWVAVFNACTLTVGGPPAPPSMGQQNACAPALRKSDFFARFGDTPPAPPALTAAAAPIPAPNTFSLLPNYPNPFNPRTTVRFEMPKRTYLSIEIYNIQGAEVRSLVNGTKSAGTHQVVWDGRTDAGQPVPSGIYLIRMQSENFVAIRKANLVR